MQVFYRFRSEKNPSRIETERSTMPLWEVKAEIVALRKLTLHDYHLVFYFENEAQPITDNYTTIHTNASIVIERVPNYMQAGYKEAMEKPKQKKEEAPDADAGSISVTSSLSARVPPPNYICFRCGEKGHYIHMCPTNRNKQYDSMRVKKATGIPKTFLVPVEETASSVLLNEEGQFVKAQPQTKEFTKHFGEKRQAKPIPAGLSCPQCSGVLVDAVLLECRHHVCEDCFRGKCPVCGEKSASRRPDTRKRREVDRFLENR